MKPWVAFGLGIGVGAVGVVVIGGAFFDQGVRRFGRGTVLEMIVLRRVAVVVLIAVLLLSSSAAGYPWTSGRPALQAILSRVVSAALVTPAPLSLSGRAPPVRWRFDVWTSGGERGCWIELTHRF